MENNLWNHVLKVRNHSPLVHSITNFVVMNNTANALLAVGASPVMAHAHAEIEEMVSISNALVVNIGTLDEYWAQSFFLAANTANSLHKPWILDPVGSGATSYRDTVLSKLLALKPSVIRGNASEVIALAKASMTTTKGVDSTAQSDDAIEAAENIVANYGSVVCISGETDVIIDGTERIFLRNGHPMMTKVTGLGCTASALIGAFIAAVDNTTEAVAAAMSLLGISGELAAAQSMGPGSLQLHLIDTLYNITEEEFLGNLNLTR
ncbi:hydroxyethylthiazole kinase [Chryseobacterium sp. SSA4.19]|uniref:hydroxyethylthiazole kinase n=1 Tax=Chryseobacterium sp. SSA4.19 TaxID=2919915 RepID=UPI001F4D51D0|nr:hydroxyethylthiazole kinase [Chryseobacterium sp. SSA4.19]MCJ8152719.1 hydroxyethylthiazole kinase [Chryseobacterium sp. SSA4.19]